MSVSETIRTVFCIGVLLLAVACAQEETMTTPSPESSQEETLIWSRTTPLPESRTDYAAGVIEGRLVISGGTYWTGSKGNWIKKHFSASTHAFDPITEVWEKLPDLPMPLGTSASAVIGDRLFVLGGFTGEEVNREIVVLENKQNGYVWEHFGQLPVDRVYARAVSVGTHLYLVGGTTRFEPTDAAGTCCTSKTATSSFMVLDTANPDQGWEQLPDLPGARRWYFKVETDGEFIWMFGGIFQAEHTDPTSRFDDVFRYNIANAEWEAVEALPEVSSDYPPTPVFVKDRIILVSNSTKVWQLDLETLRYSELPPLPEAVSVDKFFWIENRIVGAGGENSVEGPRRRSEAAFIGQFK